jgi:hypothetical protein
VRLREGTYFDPAQLPRDLKEPATQPGQPPSMLQPFSFDVSLDERARVVKVRPVDESEDSW